MLVHVMVAGREWEDIPRREKVRITLTNVEVPSAEVYDSLSVFSYFTEEKAEILEISWWIVTHIFRTYLSRDTGLVAMHQ